MAQHTFFWRWSYFGTLISSVVFHRERSGARGTFHLEKRPQKEEERKADPKWRTSVPLSLSLSLSLSFCVCMNQPRPPPGHSKAIMAPHTHTHAAAGFNCATFLQYSGPSPQPDRESHLRSCIVVRVLATKGAIVKHTIMTQPPPLSHKYAFDSRQLLVAALLCC